MRAPVGELQIEDSDSRASSTDVVRAGVATVHDAIRAVDLSAPSASSSLASLTFHGTVHSSTGAPAGGSKSSVPAAAAAAATATAQTISRIIPEVGASAATSAAAAAKEDRATADARTNGSGPMDGGIMIEEILSDAEHAMAPGDSTAAASAAAAAADGGDDDDDGAASHGDGSSQDSHQSHCFVCKEEEEPKSGSLELLLCEHCPRGFHLACLGLTKVPEEDPWCVHMVLLVDPPTPRRRSRERTPGLA